LLIAVLAMRLPQNLISILSVIFRQPVHIIILAVLIVVIETGIGSILGGEQLFKSSSLGLTTLSTLDTLPSPRRPSQI
jgi:hypothetical protein